MCPNTFAMGVYTYFTGKHLVLLKELFMLFLCVFVSSLCSPNKKLSYDTFS